MDKNLERIITQRKAQADRKDLFNKAQIITQYLGKAGSCREDWKRQNVACPPWYSIFLEGRLFIKKSTHSPREKFGIGYNAKVEVYSNEELVYEESKGQRGNYFYAYIPGEWENKLDLFYTRATRLRELNNQEKEDSNKRSQSEIKKKFGL